jgi:hypothetical protein
VPRKPLKNAQEGLRTPKNAKNFGRPFVKTETKRLFFFAFLHVSSALFGCPDLNRGDLPHDFFAATFRTLDALAF